MQPFYGTGPKHFMHRHRWLSNKAGGAVNLGEKEVLLNSKCKTLDIHFEWLMKR
jgi:hypothetical protein